MATFVLVTEKGEFFQKIGRIMGQPAAISTPRLDDAKQFRTRAALVALKAKWTGVGVGMERFTVIREI